MSSRKRGRSSVGSSRSSHGHGASRPNYPCTYDLGYVRQDVYACLNCSKDDVMSGFCGGCKIACHGEHLDRVIDLYSKRAFRCDCGNSRMENQCLLDPEKHPVNTDNARIYSHNFVGLYCICDRGFDPKLGDMSQCAVCEDWFHASCLSVAGLNKRTVTRALRSTLYEFTCRGCIGKLPVLKKYYVSLGLFKPKGFVMHESVDPNQPRDCTVPFVTCQGLPEEVDFLWPPGFREKLCTCSACKSLYNAANLSFIVDHRDFVGGGSSMPEDTFLLDETADAKILSDVLADNDTDEKQSGVRRPSLREIGDGTEVDKDHNSGGSSLPRKDSQGQQGAMSKFGFGAGAASGDEEQHAIQSRIRAFLEETIQSNGKSMTHAALLTYLADLKSEYLGNTAQDLDSSPSSQ